MARPRKTDNERIEDAFFDMNIAEQEATLRTLGTLHRMKARQSSKAWRGPEKQEPEAPLLDGVGPAK